MRLKADEYHKCKGILMIVTFGVQVKAHSHDDEIGNKTSNNNRWHDVATNVSRLMFRQDQTLLDLNDND